MDRREKIITSGFIEWSLTTTQDEHRLRTVEIPDSIKFFRTHDQQIHSLQCDYAVSNEYINTITTDTALESPHFPIYFQIKNNYFKLPLEKDLYLLVSYHQFKTKAQPQEQIQQNKIKHFKQNQLPSIRNLSVTH